MYLPMSKSFIIVTKHFITLGKAVDRSLSQST